MTTCSTIIRKFTDPADTITLDETARHRRRVAMKSDNGISFLLDLAEARHLRHGDGLLLDDGRVIRVVAEPEELLEVRARNGLHLTELAWHIGNRHLAAQIEPERILIRRDHVIEAMLTGLGAKVSPVVEIFQPVGGAYSGHGHGDDHAHGHHHHGGGHHHHHD